MTDARVKKVWPILADLYSRKAFVLDLATQMSASLGLGESIEIPSIGAFTIAASADGTNTPDTITNAVLTLTADKQPGIFAYLPRMSQIQDLGDGSWAQQVAQQAAVQLRNAIDEDFAQDYLTQVLAYDTAGTYHENVAGATLTNSMLLTVLAKLRSNDGMVDPVIVCHPFGTGAIMAIPEFIPNGTQLEAGNLGIRLIGSVYGVPCYESTSIARNRSVATTAVTVATNVATATVAAGHGIVPGQYIYTTGLTTNVASSAKVVVQSVTATTVVYALTAADGALADGVGLIITSTAHNLVFDRANVFFALQRAIEMPEIIGLSGTSKQEMQIFGVWGRIGRAGRVYVLHTPGSSVT